MKLVNQIFKNLLLPVLKINNWFIYNTYKYQGECILKRCASVGESVGLRMPSKIYYPEHLHIGNDVSIDVFTLIRAKGGVRIGDRVLIASHVKINTLTHPKTMPHRGVVIESPVIIEDDVWIGSGATILPGVKIGKGAIVGAGSVVTKNVKAYTIVAGIPAEKIGEVDY